MVFRGGTVVANRVERGTIENLLPIDYHEGGRGKCLKNITKP